MKVSDYIASFLAQRGIEQVFMLTGGGAMHLNDSLGHHPDLKVTCMHHEQACAMAAEGYARVSGKPAVVNVTTGPGGINALNGVFGAWTDSIPMIVISGQVKREMINDGDMRQKGDQEVDIISMVRAITKYSMLVRDPQDIRMALEKAIDYATIGRPGPTWLDIPSDVAAAEIDPANLRGIHVIPLKNPDLSHTCNAIMGRIWMAKRPVIMVGSGVRASGGLETLHRVIDKLGIPVVTSWTAIDAIDSQHPLYCGRPGTIGTRAGNFTVQNADLLLIIGSRMSVRQVGYNKNPLAPTAYKIMVDIDPAEMRGLVKPDLKVCSDAKLFLEALEEQIGLHDPETHVKWMRWCKNLLRRYRPVTPPQQVINDDNINPYYFLDRLTHYLRDDDVIVCGDATASVVTFQVGHVKKGQRYFTNAGCASMGYDLPAAIGAAVARGGKRVICIAGDGSIQLNIQELETIRHHNLPIKIFVLNNDGYSSMRQTQDAFFNRRVGEGPGSGITFPNMLKIAQAYGLATNCIAGKNFEDKIMETLAVDHPILADVWIDPDQPFEPKVRSHRLDDGSIVSPGLEDMSPRLPHSEMEENTLC